MKPANNGNHIVDSLPSVINKMEEENQFLKFGLPEKYGDLKAMVKQPFNFDESSITTADLKNQKFCKNLAIVRECYAIPPTWEKSKKQWYKIVTVRCSTSLKHIYELLAKVKKSGIAGLRHEKPCKSKPLKSSQETIDRFIGLKLKREHRKMDDKTLYNALIVEAADKGWKIGSLQSLRWWYKKKVSPLQEAYSKGGLRALDNKMPWIPRDYSDLAPFEMIVGDQHRLDIWAIDDDTLQLVRPEIYLWVDLRTRIAYGVAIDRHYDAHLMAMALRHGLISWGAFGSILTDNGRPELSKHIISILANMRSLGLEWAKTVDMPLDIIDYDGEEIQPCVIIPGTHKKAVVKNAKAKLIERYFQELERALINHLKLPGYVKDLKNDIHSQEVDENEVKRLHEQGKLPYLSEVAGAVMEACNYLNRQHHRGIAREWIWGKPPQVASPLACLVACCNAGWRQRFITQSAIDTLLLKKEERIVNKGRIAYQNDFYEHDELLNLHGRKVTIYCPEPLSENSLIVFLDDKFLCTAFPATYSSMKDMKLARQKIIEKRSRRKRIAESVRALTAGIPDLRNYPASNLEKQAAAISADQRRRAIELKAESRIITQDELDRGVQMLEELNRIPAKKSKPLAPPRPSFWMSDAARHDWSILAFVDGMLSSEDRAWMETYEAAMEPAARERWEFERQYRLQEAEAIMQANNK